MRHLFKIILSVLIMSVLCSCAHLNLREGIQSFRDQDYRRAFIRLKPEAEKGQPDAQYAVGYMYYYGQGVVENREQAWYWINTAAGLGQTQAQEAVALLKKGSMKKRKVFESASLHHYPVVKEMY